jgi:hypothetical protein
MLDRIRRLIASLVPRRQEQEVDPATFVPPAPDDGTVAVTPEDQPPAEGTPPAAAADATPEGTPQGGERTPGEQAAIDQAAQLEEANRRIEVLERAEQAEIDRRAEERLHQLLPELPSSMDAERMRREQRYEPTATPETPLEDLTEEERLERLEANQQRMELDVQADNVMREVESYRQRFPMMNTEEVLRVLMRAGDSQVNIGRLCELSHNRQHTEYEGYHEARLKDADYMRSLVETYHREHGGSPPATPPRVPTGGATGAPVDTPPITRENATQTFIERAKARGWPRK